MKLLGGSGWLLACLCLVAAEPALDPVPVCEIAADLKPYEGHTAAVVGRYSFRKTGRWLDQEGCGSKRERGVLWLVLDASGAPKPPEQVEMSEAGLSRKLAAIKEHTLLGKFRFGSADYDRWAVVYGRVEARKEGDMQLVYRGDGAVIFFVDK